MDAEIGLESSSNISMHEFLDFLKVSCQLQESIDQRNTGKNNEHQIDYNDLAKNGLVNSLTNPKPTPSPSADSGEANVANSYTTNGK